MSEITRMELEAQVAELLPDREEMRVVFRGRSRVANGGAGGPGGQVGSNNASLDDSFDDNQGAAGGGGGGGGGGGVNAVGDDQDNN